MQRSIDYIPNYLNAWDAGFVNVVMLVAKKAADLAIGEGVIFDSSNDKIREYLEEFVDRTQLSTKLWKFAYMNSMIGRSHLWLTKTESGKFDIVLSEILSSTRVSMYNEIETAAQIFTNKQQGDQGWYYQIDFYEKKCVITSYVDDKITQIGSVITGVPKTARWVNTMEYPTGIDIVPIIETTNLPRPKYFASNTFTFFPDWEPVYQLLNDEQDIIKQKRKERRKNQTWFNGVLTPQVMEAVMRNGGDLVETLQDGLIQNSGNGYTKGEDIGFDIQYGNPPMDQYNSDWLFVEIQIFNGCGYNHPREAEFQSYTNKAQTLVNSILDEQTTRVKQQYYKTKIFRLIDYMLIAEGLWDRDKDPKRPYSMDFKSIGLSDILQKDQLINSRLQNGTISRVQAIQEYDGITTANAEKMMVEIDEEIDNRLEETRDLEARYNEESENKEDDLNNNSDSDLEVKNIEKEVI